MIKLLLQHFILDHCITAFFNALTDNFSPIPHWDTAFANKDTFIYTDPITGEEILHFEGCDYLFDDDEDCWILDESTMSDELLIDILNDMIDERGDQ